MDRTLARDSSIYNKMQQDMDIEEIKHEFIEYMKLFYHDRIFSEILPLTLEELRYMEQEDGKLIMSFSNGCDDIILGTIYHSFCIFKGFDISFE